MIDNLSNKSEINQRRETTQDDCEDELHFVHLALHSLGNNCPKMLTTSFLLKGPRRIELKLWNIYSPRSLLTSLVCSPPSKQILRILLEAKARSFFNFLRRIRIKLFKSKSSRNGNLLKSSNQ